MFLALFLFCEVKPLKRFTHRLLPLVLCLSLTLGAFVYRPPEAKAIAGVDDAVVIGALLTAFSAGCGLIFANNGMTSNEIAQGMTQKWNEFKDTLSTVPSSFASWLGYGSTEELLASCVIVGPSKMNITRPIARKFAEFTDWLTKDLGVTAGGEMATISDLSAVEFYQFDGTSISKTMRVVPSVLNGSVYSYSLGTPVANMADFPLKGSGYLRLGFGKDGGYIALLYNSVGVDGTLFPYCGVSGNFGSLSRIPESYSDGEVYLIQVSSSPLVYSLGMKVILKEGNELKDALVPFSYGDFHMGVHPPVFLSTDLSVRARVGFVIPDLAGEKDIPVGFTGVGDGTATTIEELLRQILTQVQANTLAPTIEGVDTETGGGTDTEEDAKPYLPYIPQIFGKIKDLPDTLSNIWETIKGIPAAIAEKIGAFFTTLWGWLQSIIDAITALPAAIAEKIAALFTPDEALVTEITDTFKGKFGFLPTLKQFGNDLFGMTAETEPPVIWVHFENAESKYGYDYGGKEKMLDLSWYQKYKANVDTLISGFLWLGFLWLLFKRAAAIIQGGEMLAEYGHDLSQGRRDSNETKFQRYLWKD